MTSGGGVAFVSVDDLRRAWRPLTGQERVDAELLLAAAANWIREKKPDIAADDPNAIFVSIDVVKTAISTGAYRGHIAYSRTTGPRSKSGTLATPGGGLMFTDWHRDLLGISTVAKPRYYFGDCPQ